MNSLQHTPVLLAQTVSMLNVRPEGTYIDCTAGFGGHAKAIAALLNEKGRLLAIDQDEVALSATKQALSGSKANCQVVKGNFADLAKIAAANAITAADGIVYDLGVSSMQLDDPARGFSYAANGPLDMRMDRSLPLDAAKFVNQAPVSALVKAFKEYADSKVAPRVAGAIVSHRPIADTTALASVIEQAIPAAIRFKQRHPAQKYFQAIRMVVNNEIENLRFSLEQAKEMLAPGGRICVITFHSLEDRVAKRSFTAWSAPLVPKEVPTLQSQSAFRMVMPRGIVPSTQETEQNKRARSARLRVIERTVI